MRTKPLLIALIATGVSVAAVSTPASADVGAGVLIGGTIGAVVGGPPGAAVGMVLGAAIGDSEEQRHARVYGYPRYADAPRVALPPPGFRGVPPDYYAAAPRVVYPAPVYYAPRRYYRYY